MDYRHIEWLSGGLDLRSIAMVEARRSEVQWDEAAKRRVRTTTVQRRYYIRSLSEDTAGNPAECIGEVVRVYAGASRTGCTGSWT